MSTDRIPSSAECTSHQASRVLGLILARGGSKRLPGKNIRQLCGKPLVAWSIESSLASASVARTVVSTDSPEIADAALQHGADVPFLRPASLAGDVSTSADAAVHALDWLRDEERQEFDVVVLLEPTSPLRGKHDIDAVIALLRNRWDETDAIVSVGAVQLEQPGVMKAMDDDGFLRPWVAGAPSIQQHSAALFPYGVAYAIKVAALRQWRTFYPPKVIGYTIQRWQNYEVDDELDFLCIEAVMKHFEGALP
jgi:CMP-N,N'-diacetyllegionaminic acid synthase